MSAASDLPFGLDRSPFALAPDTHFAYLAGAAGGILAELEREMTRGGGGVTLLTGGSGSGKTLLAQCLLERLAERDVRVARILHSRVTPLELLQSVCTRLRVPLDERVDRNSGRDLVNALSAFLMDIYAQGQRVLLVVDEAQNLTDESLEQLRLLTNLETPVHQLMQVLLLATPRIRTRLHTPALQPLAQRITARHELSDMDARETEAYVRHRLTVAGTTQVPFSRLALRDLQRASHGVPRVINLVGERALALAAERQLSVVGERVVQQAAREAVPGHVGYWWRRYRGWVVVVGGVAIAVAAVVWWGQREPAAPNQPVVRAAPEVSASAQAQQVIKALPGVDDARLQAWSTLLARWQVGSDEASVTEAAACPVVIFAGFDCVGGSGTLDQLARFDRPLVLVLDTPTGARQVLLLGVGQREARLDIGPRDVTLSRAALAQLWHGRFYAPFRLPATLPTLFKRGDQGAGVTWLRRQLSRLDGDAGTAGPALFDAAMEARVKRLQRVFGIPDDGIVGPETLFALMSLEPHGPHLARGVP